MTGIGLPERTPTVTLHQTFDALRAGNILPVTPRIGAEIRDLRLSADLPQPVIWWDEDGEQAAVAVQAESHLNAEGEAMEVLGLILPDGGGAVALMDDVDLVDASDPTWRDLVTNAIDPGAADD